MKPRLMLKMGIDLMMTILLLCQMAYMLMGEALHEWMGTGMFALFLLHHVLNWRWYRQLVKGKYTALRTLQTIVDFLIVFSMLGLMVSGIMMSREVFAFLSIDGGMGFARMLHMLAAYWGFILMSIHLGLHWGMVMGAVRKMTGKAKASRAGVWILRGLALMICGFGVYAFMKHNLSDYLLMRSQFVFFDMEQPLTLFLAEYLAMMGLWCSIADYSARILQRLFNKKDMPKTNYRSKA